MFSPHLNRNIRGFAVCLWIIYYISHPLEWKKPRLVLEGQHYHIPNRLEIYRQICSMIQQAWAHTGHMPVVGLCKEPRTLHADSGTVFGHCNCEGV